MALPKIDLPIYELELPSNGKKIKYVPFTVKEEKILLMAKESKDSNQIITSIKQIINNCVLDYDIDSLALFDLEYILITIRSKSIDNIISFEITDPDTEEKISLKLDLSNVKVEKNESHTNKIKISDDYIMYLKYPNVDDFFQLLTDKNPSTEKNYNIMISCMDKLASEDEVFNFKDFSQKEIDDFVESLSSNVTIEMKKFFDTMPKVRHEIKYLNSKQEEKTFVIQGTQSFFM
jgi:hypothetical protein